MGKLNCSRFGLRRSSHGPKQVILICYRASVLSNKQLKVVTSNRRYRRVRRVIADDPQPPPQTPGYLPGTAVVVTLYDQVNKTAYELTLDKFSPTERNNMNGSVAWDTCRGSYEQKISYPDGSPFHRDNGPNIDSFKVCRKQSILGHSALAKRRSLSLSQ